MTGRRGAALQWGLVGALTFAVLYQGYVLAGADWDGTVLGIGTLSVGFVTTALAYALAPRLGSESL